MSDVLTTLMSKLLPSPGGAPAISANSDEFWLRANDRFDIRASWVHEERNVELSALLRAPEHESLVPAPEADHPDCTAPARRRVSGGTCCSGIQHRRPSRRSAVGLCRHWTR